ncbi:BZ3500_MvSof-1268-A1-R1_C145g00771 [Microbotryum saponariae]|uniref:BZ3500_MvSof-1268-A1-R1_C145g00771 protein n=1 Tax=Microbotryum saponariae TaxID=289078 RepID=A0A2X0MLZ2_9BASI|nr:BZ3500_MvSof-1268-A1-R1_C145g00771 [Microbotryum saponariae]
MDSIMFNRIIFARASTAESPDEHRLAGGCGGTETVDMQEALGIASRHAQSLFTPDPARGDPTNARRSLLDPIRAAKCYDDDRSDPTFGRRLPRQARVALDEPFTLLEVEAALKKTDSGDHRGLGHSVRALQGAANLLCSQAVGLVQLDLGGRQNDASLAEGLVRLLPKNKPGANLKSLGHTDRSHCARRPTRSSARSWWATQWGARRAFTAGATRFHAIKTFSGRGKSSHSPSRKTQSAYDRVDHAWIFEVFEAFGFGERFISLLRALYDPETLGVRYLVNGFPTDLVRLLCGLGQGDPLSCPVWNITFQPFLDALVRRGIALDLQKVWPGGPRAQLTHLAFADDAVVVVESRGIVEAANAVADVVRGYQREDQHGQTLLQVCGYAFFRHGDSKLFWTHVLDRIKAKTRAARDRNTFAEWEGFLCNAHIISTVPHVLSFDIPPQWFIKAAETALTDFVWGGAGRNTVARDFVFQARETVAWVVSIGDIVHSVALLLGSVAGSDEAIWAPLARESWSTARVEKLYRDSTRWGQSLQRPGSQFQPSNADLYWRDEGKGWALVGHRRGSGSTLRNPPYSTSTCGRAWSVAQGESVAAQDRVATCSDTSQGGSRPRCFNFFGLSRPFTIRKLRRLVNKVRFPGREDRVKRFPDGTSQSDRKRFWRWLHDRFASAVEQDTHWRFMYDVTPTRKRQYTQGHASSPTCLFCGNDAAVIETVSHYFFECAYSTSFWGGVLRILLDKLGIEDTDVDPSTFTPEQLTMGLPLLRGPTSPFIPKSCVGFRRMDRSFALVKIYGMDREERSLVFLVNILASRRGSFRCIGSFSLGPTAQQPALETQPREDIRRCRGDE